MEHVHTHLRSHIDGYTVLHGTHTHKQAILDVLAFQKPLHETITSKRFHHQLYPNHVLIQTGFPEEYREDLKERGHEIQETEIIAVIQGIHVESPGVIHAVSDPWKGGKPDGY